jgi:TPR repeat protein
MSVNRHGAGAAAGLLCWLLVSGCAEPDVRPSDVRPEDVRPASTLIGQTRQEVQAAWGAPYLEFEDPRSGQRYLMYSFREPYVYYQFMILPRHNTLVYCYLFEMTEDDVVKTFYTPNTFSSVSFSDDCLVSFFSDDFEMAAHLAQKYRKPSALRHRAFDGDVEAARLLAKKSTPSPAELIAFASEGGPGAGYGVYKLSDINVADGIAALKDLCKAAQQDNGRTQFLVATLQAEDGWLHLDALRKQLRDGAGFFPNDAVAYYWYRQAERNNTHGSKAKIAELAAKMDPRDVDMAKGWEFDPLTEFELAPNYPKLFGAPGFTECPLPITGEKNKKALIRLRTKARAMAGDPNAARRMGDFDRLRSFSYAGALFEQGDADVAYLVYTRMRKGEGVSAQGWHWLCRAADAGIADARREVGYWHRTDRWARADEGTRAELRQAGFEPDDVRAYMWYTLAGDGEISSPRVPERLIRNTTPTGVARAQQMAREWKPGACPRASGPLAPPD